jgi:hypothetical protein
MVPKGGSRLIGNYSWINRIRPQGPYKETRHLRRMSAGIICGMVCPTWARWGRCDKEGDNRVEDPDTVPGNIWKLSDLIPDKDSYDTGPFPNLSRINCLKTLNFSLSSVQNIQ